MAEGHSQEGTRRPPRAGSTGFERECPRHGPTGMARGKSLAAFREEARKCVLVCANCHGEIEAGLVISPTAGAKWEGRRA